MLVKVAEYTEQLRLRWLSTAKEIFKQRFI